MSFLAGLDAVGIRYCVLRNHELIPTEPGRDIDLVAPDTSLHDAESVLKRIAAEGGWRTVLRCRGHHEGTSYYLLIDDASQVTQLEIHFTRVRWAGIPIMDSDELLAERVRSGSGLWIASPTQVVVQRLLQFGLSGQLLEMKDDYWIETVGHINAYPNEVTAKLAGYLGTRSASQVVSLGAQDDRPGVASQIVGGRAAFMMRSLTRPRAWSGLASKSVEKVAERFGPARCGVVGVVRDGQTADAIANAVSTVFTSVSVVAGTDVGIQSESALIDRVNRVGLVLVVGCDWANILGRRRWRATAVDLRQLGLGEAVVAVTGRFAGNHQVA